jgi:hypothetical protein
MKQIGLVSSINGLGHTRRLAHLALSFSELGFRATVFATRKQIKRLRFEFSSPEEQINFSEISSHGIDGPVWLNDGCIIESPSHITINKIQKCDLVISDNSIWPSRFNVNFILFGHFNWLNYWNAQTDKIFSKKTQETFEEEIQLLSKVNMSILLKHFSLKGKYNSQQNIQLKLPRYKSDSSFPKKIKPNSIWIANGTTGIGSSFNYKNLTRGHSNFELVETFKLITSSNKPSLVIGRPGLGTIRDCLASGTVFVPYMQVSDPELESNVLNLKKLSLISNFSLLEPSSAMNIEMLLKDFDLLESWSCIWPSISEDLKDISQQIIDLNN